MSNNNLKIDPKALMRLAKGGDSEAFNCLYELYFVPVFRYISLRVKNKEEAEDLTQNVFLKVYRSIPDFQEQNKPPLAYFFTIARNTLIDSWRKKKDSTVNLEAISETPDPGANPQESTEKRVAAQAIRQIIQNLTEDQREVIILKFINEMPNNEIARLLEKSEDAIRQLQCRALKALREQIKNSELL